MKGRGNHLGCLLLTVCLLWILPGCGRDSSAPSFPPKEGTVRAAAEKLGWTLDPEGTRSWAEDQVVYAFRIGEQGRGSISCALAEGKRVLTENETAFFLTDKPEFDWEDWKKAVNLAETLYGGFDQGELYAALSQQDTPEIQSEESPDRESLSWEVELPAGYGRVWWSVSPGTVEKNFPSPAVQDWRSTLSVSLYESREAYENGVSGETGSPQA